MSLCDRQKALCMIDHVKSEDARHSSEHNMTIYRPHNHLTNMGFKGQITFRLISLKGSTRIVIFYDELFI